MYKIQSTPFYKTLEILFNKCWETNTFPKQWGEVLVLPIPKPGNTKNPKNYRPISLVNTMAKVYMGIIQQRILRWAEDCNILPDTQTAFRSQMGCTEQIFTLSSLIAKQLTSPTKCTYAFFADLSKAFDSVEHTILWEKLQAYRVPPHLLQNIKNYYNQLSMQVKTPAGLTKSIQIKRGVLQGDPLSPILFNLFIADLPDYIPNTYGLQQNKTHTKILMFADDLVLLASSAIKLKNTLKKLKTYLCLNNLTLNINKTKIIIFAKRKKPIHNTPIRWDNKEIEIVSEWKYLGITLNRLRKIDTHIKNIKSMISHKQNTLIQYMSNKKINNLPIHVNLFNALIRSSYTYATPAWAWSNYEKLESIQYQYFRRLFLLPIRTPAYLLHSELGLYPYKINLINATFNFWIKTLTNKKPPYVWDELSYWLTKQKNPNNPWFNFFQCLQIPNNLKQTPLNRLTQEEINTIRYLTIENEKLTTTTITQAKVFNSWYHNHYQAFGEVVIQPKEYFKMKIPWILTRLTLQIRINPSSIYFKGTQIDLDETAPCHLCNSQNQSWTHLLSACPVIKDKIFSKRTTSNQNIPLNLNKILTKPEEPFLWSLFKILALIANKLSTIETSTSSSSN